MIHMVSAHSLYSSKIIKAGALIADTELLFLHWQIAQSVQLNMKNLKETNAFGKASRSRIQDILTVFRQRYMQDDSLPAALAALAQNHLPTHELTPILYALSALNDTLLRDVVIDVILPRWERQLFDITPGDLRLWLDEQIALGKTTSAWGELTRVCAVRNMMSALRDFGVLEGKNRKRIRRPALPIRSFAFLARWLQTSQASGEKILQHPLWRLFYLRAPDVERIFVEADLSQLLSYQAAGSIVRIDFPKSSLEEYAHAIARTTL